MKMRTLFVISLLAVSSQLFASTLSMTAAADDTFEAFISTSAAVEGTSFVVDSDSFWGTPSSGATTLTGSGTYYVHVKAKDIFGSPTAFIGSLSLSDTSFQFSNGGQTLDSNMTDWTISDTGYTGTPLSMVDHGANGVSPWGTISGISANAHWIWSTDLSQGTRYLTTVITAVPEPSIFAVIGVGLGLLIIRRKRA